MSYTGIRYTCYKIRVDASLHISLGKLAAAGISYIFYIKPFVG